MLPVQLLQPLARHMRVDRGGGDIDMPLEQLHHPQIRAVIEQMRGKSVTQGMR